MKRLIFVSIAVSLFMLMGAGVVGAQQFVGVSATATGETTAYIVLSVTNGTPVRLMRSAGSCASSQTLVNEWQNPQGNVSYSDSGLTPGTVYCYRLLVYMFGSWQNPGFTSLITTQGGTPVPTSTPTNTPGPTATATVIAPRITPTPTPTRIPDCIVDDYHFISPDWFTKKSAHWSQTANVTWEFSKYSLPPGGSISQTVALSYTMIYSVSLRASASTTTSLAVHVGAVDQTFVITRPTMRNYELTAYSEQSPTVRLTNISTGTITVDRVCLFPVSWAAMGDSYGTQSFIDGQPMAGQPQMGVDLAEMQEGLEPYDFSGGGGLPAWNPFAGSNVTELFTNIFKIGVTIITIMSPSIVGVWFGGRILLLAALWFFAFVMRRIGLKMPTSDAYVHGTDTNYRLPRMPRSGIRLYGGRRRRGRW